MPPASVRRSLHLTPRVPTSGRLSTPIYMAWFQLPFPRGLMSSFLRNAIVLGLLAAVGPFAIGVGALLMAASVLVALFVLRSNKQSQPVTH